MPPPLPASSPRASADLKAGRGGDSVARSAVRSIKRTGPVDDTGAASLSIEQLLSTLGSTPAAQAHAESQAMRQLLSEQQTALRRALRAASEFEEEAATARREADGFRDELRKVETELASERQVRVRENTVAAAEISALKVHANSAAAERNEALERGGRDRRVYGWLAGVSVATAVGLTVLLFHPEWTSRFVIAPPPVSVAREETAPKPAKPPLPPRRSDPNATAETKALERLTDALSVVPGAAMDDVLDHANAMLKEAGQPKCTVLSAEGVRSLSVAGAKNDKPLTEALARCASAVEKLTR